MTYVAQWIKGEPEKTFLGSTKTDGKKHFVIVTHRYRNCGFLECHFRLEIEPLLRQFKELQKLCDDDKRIIKTLIEAFLARRKIEQLMAL